jgi:hypothetical protein
MKRYSPRFSLLLALSLILLLPGCFAFGSPPDSEEMKKIDEQIRESIEKTFPLPESVVIKTHVGDDLRFSTELSFDAVIVFYRDSYTHKGYAEVKDSQISPDSATLLFQKDGEKDVQLEVTRQEKGSVVHLFLK